MTIPFTHMLFLAILLFVMGAACAMTRKSLFMILIGVEVMLNAAGIAFVAAAMRWTGHERTGHGLVCHDSRRG